MMVLETDGDSDDEEGWGIDNRGGCMGGNGSNGGSDGVVELPVGDLDMCDCGMDGSVDNNDEDGERFAPSFESSRLVGGISNCL